MSRSSMSAGARLSFALCLAVGSLCMAPAAWAQTPQRGGNLVVISNPEPANLAPFMNSGATTVETATKVYEGLLEYDFSLKPLPSLAESWNISADGLTYTFKLRSGVKWHDGRPFTSSDVQFSVIEAVKKLHPRGRGTLAAVDAVDTPDPQTAVFRLSKPIPALIRALGSDETPMIPRHVFEGQDFNTNPAVNKPVGTGPFVLREWQRGSHMVFERNPNYYKPGLPYLDRVVFRFVSDAGTRVAMMERGEADVASNDAVPFEDLQRLSKLPQLHLELRGHEAYGPIMLMELNTRRGPLADVRVRRAIHHALDRNFIINNVWFGFGLPATGPIPSTMKEFYTGDVYKFDFNPAKAKEMLDQAGFKPDANGVRFTLTHDVLPFGGSWRRMGQYLVQALGDVGIRVTLRQEDLPAFIKRVYTDYDFDITSNWFLGLSDPTLGVQRIYWGGNIKPGVAFGNSSRYANPRVDELWVNAAVEPDPAKRVAMFTEIQKTVVNDVPVIWVMERPFTALHKKTVMNLMTRPQGIRSSLETVWIAK